MVDIELKYAHLGYRDTPARKAALRKLIEEIQAEQTTKSAAPQRSLGPTLRLAPRYRDDKPRKD